MVTFTVSLRRGRGIFNSRCFGHDGLHCCEFAAEVFVHVSLGIWPLPELGRLSGTTWQLHGQWQLERYDALCDPHVPAALADVEQVWAAYMLPGRCGLLSSSGIRWHGSNPKSEKTMTSRSQKRLRSPCESKLLSDSTDLARTQAKTPKKVGRRRKIRLPQPKD